METIGTATMSERGQIIIPKEIRDHINATGNTIFTVGTLDEGTIIMKKLDTAKILSEFRNIRVQAKKMSTEDINKEIRAVRKQKRNKQ